MNLEQIVLEYIETSELYKGEISWERLNGCVEILDKSTFEEQYFKHRPNIPTRCVDEANSFIRKFKEDLTLYKVSDSYKMRSGYLLVDKNKDEIDFLDVIYY